MILNNLEASESATLNQSEFSALDSSSNSHAQRLEEAHQNRLRNRSQLVNRRSTGQDGKHDKQGKRTNNMIEDYIPMVELNQIL